MNRPALTAYATLALALVVPATHAEGISSSLQPTVIVSTAAEPMAPGKFAPTWQSLAQYKTPEWFRDAKFGIWAHWGPQCEPEQGDWYARKMYLPGDAHFKYHAAHYGDQATNGFKDVIHQWKAERWNPDKLLALYKRAGAQYFFALANHHDNFDNWDSKYQPWNSVNMGPQKDLIAGWARAARNQGMRFGVSVHAAHAWTWYEPAQNYDGKLTKADGRGLWWDGYDPQHLYAQSHTPTPGFEKSSGIHGRWNWGNGASQPDTAYCEKFYNRTVDLINRYRPDLVYFDDTALPLWPVSDAGLKIAAHFYNRNMQLHHGRNEAVLFGKILDEDQQQCMAWDIERGVSPVIVPHPWQTDTCIGGWHYERRLYEQNKYKSARTVIHMLTDIVSKNGNLLLSVPVRADGTIDDKETAIVSGVAAWMEVNHECIFGTRPWKVFGEGPASEGAALNAQGFNEGKGKPNTAADFRFTQKDGKLYAIELGWPTNLVTIKSLGTSAGLLDKTIKQVHLIGSREKLKWTQTAEGLVIEPPKHKPSDIAVVYRITFAGCSQGATLPAAVPAFDCRVR